MYLPVVLSDLNMTTYDIKAKYCEATYDETFLLTNSRLKLVNEEEDFKQTAEKFANELLLEEEEDFKQTADKFANELLLELLLEELVEHIGQID